MSYALLTASTGGFGPVIAQHLLNKGYSLILHGRDLDRLENLNQNLENPHHRSIILLQHDIRTHSDEFTPFLNKLGAIEHIPNLVIHHIGGTLGFKSATSSLREWLDVITLNFLFSVAINNFYIPKALETRVSMRIIHISSISSVTLRGSSPYACSKSLVNSYVVSLARELALSNIHVSAILPGAFNTPGSNWDQYNASNPGLVDDFLRHHHACGRLGKPQEILPAIDFLANPMNTFAHGTLVNIDGGTM